MIFAGASRRIDDQFRHFVRDRSAVHGVLLEVD
jgi:hypothetical protein